MLTFARKNKLLCGARTNKTNKTNFSETFSFQPTIQFKRVQYKSSKSTQKCVIGFVDVGCVNKWVFPMCESWFLADKIKIQQDRVATLVLPSRTQVYICMLIWLGVTNLFTAAEPIRLMKPTFERLWEFSRRPSPKVFRESRISEDGNMYSRTKVLCVSPWRCWVWLGRTNLVVVPDPKTIIKTTFQRLWEFNPRYISQVFCEFRFSGNTILERLSAHHSVQACPT